MLKKKFIKEILEAREAIALYFTFMLLMHELLQYVIFYLPWRFHSLFL